MNTFLIILISTIFTLSLQQANSQPNNAARCNLSELTIKDGPIFEEIKTFYQLGGCMVEVNSIGDSLLMGPFYLVTKFNQGNLEQPYGIGMFSRDRKRLSSYFNTLESQSDVLTIYAPVMIASGVVYDRTISPEVFDKIQEQVTDKINITEKKRLFVIGAYALPNTIVHEFHHLKELESNRLQTIRKLFDTEMKALSLRISAALTADASKPVVRFVLKAKKFAEELTAIRAEYDFLALHGEFQGDFMRYLEQPDDNYRVDLPTFIEELTTYTNSGQLHLRDVGSTTCQYLELSFKETNMESSFNSVFQTCRD